MTFQIKAIFMCHKSVKNTRLNFCHKSQHGFFRDQNRLPGGQKKRSVFEIR